MSSPRRSSRSGTRGYAHLVEIDVPVGRVWRALTDPGLIRIWSGQDAEIDAREGGLYRIGKRNAGGREAHIDIFEVNRRLRLIYLSSADMPSSDSAVVDDFLLDVRKGEGTASLRVLGSGVSDSREWDKPYARMRMTWERYLSRIKVALESPPQPKKPPPAPKDPPLPGLDYERHSQPFGLVFPLLRSWQKRRFLPAETKLMSEKAPQATFSDEIES